MSELLFDYGLFLLKVITVTGAVIAVLVVPLVLVSRNKGDTAARVEVENLNERYDAMAEGLQAALLPRRQFKALAKQRKARRKVRQKQADDERPRVFVLDFDGDIKASEVASLREEISAVLLVARADDEVFLRLGSAGGMVHAYGLAASQLARLRERGIPLTVAVDKVAASGGYMMACVADRIIAAPFAILGSIGVLMQLPNFNRLLKKHDIDYEQITAGEYKRTLTLFGENTDKARDKVREEIEQTHVLFKQFISRYRPEVDIEQVATGEHWFASQALERKLVDELKTSDDYLLERRETADLYRVSYSVRKGLGDRLAEFFVRLGARLSGLWGRQAREGALSG